MLLTGATGNVGIEIIKNLSGKSDEYRLIAGVRNPQSESKILNEYGVETVYFDFEDQTCFENAFTDCDTLFLLRPPQLADVKKYFEPMMAIAVAKNVGNIVFLSVQGAETNSYIPHHKIEKLIEQSGISYTFLRPAYFMQNFTTTLRKDLLENSRVFLPAGKAKFTLIDVEDLGLFASQVLKNPIVHRNKSYELTNHEQLSFGEMADILTQVLDKKVNFISPNLVFFFLEKRKERVPIIFIFVMIMLHYFPRFKSTPKTTNWIEEITGKKPKTFREFALANQDLLK